MLQAAATLTPASQDEAVGAAREGVSWRAAPEVGSALGLRVVAATWALLGRRAAGALLWLVCWYFVLFAAGPRRASRDFFRRLAQPAGPRAVHAHFVTFARVALDRLLFLTGRTEGLQVTLHGHEHVMRLAAAGSGGLLVGSHLGSFEAMRALASRYDVPLLVLVDFANARRVNALLQRLAPGLRLRLLELDPEAPLGLLAVQEALARGELVAVLGDRATHRPGRDAVVRFLGADAAFPVGPWVLAHVLGCPVYFVCALFSPPGTYDVFCTPLAERVELPRATRPQALHAQTQRYAEVLERFVRRAPRNWFNFFAFWSTP